MKLSIFCSDQEELERAASFWEERVADAGGRDCRREEALPDSVSFSFSVEEDVLETLLVELLKYSKADFSASYSYDIPDRDSSWWGTTTYKTVKDRDGVRRITRSSSTNWA